MPSRRAWRRVRRGWIAFCSGWWLAGIVLGVRHAVELWTRPSTSLLELVGVPLVAGTFLPGALPLFAAAGVRGSTGLPVGLTGTFAGVALAAVVWLTLPVVVHRDRRRSDVAVARTFERVAAIPYVAAGAGLGYLYGIDRARGRETLPAAGRVLAAAVVAYLAGASVVFAIGLVGGI